MQKAAERIFEKNWNAMRAEKTVIKEMIKQWMAREKIIRAHGSIASAKSINNAIANLQAISGMLQDMEDDEGKE